MRTKKLDTDDSVMLLEVQRCKGLARADNEISVLKPSQMVKSRYRNDSILWTINLYLPRPSIISVVRVCVGHVNVTSMPFANGKVEKNRDRRTFSLVHGLEIHWGRPIVESSV